MFAHRKFLTRDRQVYIVDKQCVLCGLQEESFEHLFFKCAIIQGLWNRMRSWLRLRKLMGSAAALLDAFHGIYRGSTRIHKTRHATIAETIYHIWDIRNKKIFENENPELKKVLWQIKITMHSIRALKMTQPAEIQTITTPGTP